jgi:hypothetical protein
MGALFLSLGFTGSLPAAVEGVYPLKLKTLTVFDLSANQISIFGNTAELTDSKPDFLEVEGIDYENSSNYKFGNFRIGNNEKKVWFLITRNSTGYWDNCYLDQNSDDKLTKKEAVKGFQDSEFKKSGYRILRADMLIPVPIRVSFKGMTKEYEKNLYFFISTFAESKKDEYHVAVMAFSASFLEGQLKATVNKEQRIYRFTIIDANSNGCFNDYGQDLLYINVKRDNSFHKNESQKLTEFFDSVAADGTHKQLRFNLLPYCLRLGVSDATADFDLAQLEPETSDEDTKTENESKAAGVSKAGNVSKADDTVDSGTNDETDQEFDEPDSGNN